MKTNKGFSLIEIVVCLSIVGVLTYAAGRGMKGYSTNAFNLDRAEVTNSSLALASSLILKVGALASSSGSVCTSTATTLSCEVDFNVPPTGLVTPVRFIVSNINGSSALLYQFQIAGTWQTKLTFPNITSLEVCNEGTMKAIPPTCSLPNAAITNTFSSFAPSGLNRFFRYRLKSLVSQGRVFSLQGAFYVRNSPFDMATNTSYQWGTQWE